MASILDSQIKSLQVIGGHLHHLHAHNVVVLLRHSYSIPKLLYVWDTSPTFMSPLPVTWDLLLLSIASNITNINFQSSTSDWLQATLPVGSVGLGIQRAAHLAPSAFLVSADGAHSLMQDLLPAWSPFIIYTHRTGKRLTGLAG